MKTYRYNHRVSRGAFLVVLLGLAVASRADIVIRLKNDFITAYKDRLTLAAPFVIDKAHARPNAGAKDGDLHIAGRSDIVKLPMVSEIMNARSRADAVDFIHQNEGTGSAVEVTGVWRLWCEHAGGSDQIQGQALSPFTTTNPDHVFELHPLVRVGSLDLKDTFKPIQGFKTKEAAEAFRVYERTRCQIKPGADETTITTEMAGYNYVEFVLSPHDNKVEKVSDGRFVPAEIYGLDGELVGRNVYTGFVKGSAPEVALQKLKPGQSLHVLGIPRISLARLWWRVQNESKRPGCLTWNLPYEIIVLGSYGPVATPKAGLAVGRSPADVPAFAVKGSSR